MNFKNGDRVTCTINGTEITDARISIDKDGTPFICQNVVAGSPAKDKLGYKYSWMLDEDFTALGLRDLKLATPTWNTLAVEDIILDRFGKKRMVLDVRNDLVWFSAIDYFDISWDWHTKKQLQDKGYTIEGAAPAVEEITIEEDEKENPIKNSTILGKSMTLASVLAAIGDNQGRFTVDTAGRISSFDGVTGHWDVYGIWNLSKDNFNDQSEETKTFIGGLLNRGMPFKEAEARLGVKIKKMNT